jgi:anti-anti-sigma regulatory factor
MHTPFELPPEINIYNVLETRDALLAWVSEQLVKGSARLEVSARDVTDVDGSGLQLLAALSNMEHSWRLVEASAAFAQACRTIGFGHWLDQRVAA